MITEQELIDKFKKFKKLSEDTIKKFVTLPIKYKVLSTIVTSILIHISFSILLYIGLYNYTSEYQVPFNIINEFDINLLILPFYKDTFFSVIIMLVVALISIMYFAGKPEKKDDLDKYEIKEIEEKDATEDKIQIEDEISSLEKSTISDKDISLSHLWGILEGKLYKSFKKAGKLDYLNKKKLKFYSRASLVVIMGLIVALIYFIFYIDPFFYIISYIFIPILIGMFIVDTRKFVLRELLYILIIFTVLSMINIFKSHGISNYLQDTHMGGNSLIKLTIENKKTVKRNLILLTKKRIFVFDKAKSEITQMPVKSVKEIIYEYKKLDPGTTFVDQYNLLIDKLKIH